MRRPLVVSPRNFLIPNSTLAPLQLSPPQMSSFFANFLNNHFSPSFLFSLFTRNDFFSSPGSVLLAGFPMLPLPLFIVFSLTSSAMLRACAGVPFRAHPRIAYPSTVMYLFRAGPWETFFCFSLFTALHATGVVFWRKVKTSALVGVFFLL